MKILTHGLPFEWTRSAESVHKNQKRPSQPARVLQITSVLATTNNGFLNAHGHDDVFVIIIATLSGTQLGL